jgi:Family of unknown function (DUF6134)
MAIPHARNLVARRAACSATAAWSFCLLTLAVLAFGRNSAARGAEAPQTVESQRREFAILIDGIKRGTCTMQIRRLSDGTVWMRSESQIRINYLVYRYNYTSSGTEVWKKGRLLAMKNSADFNGTKYDLMARSNNKSIQLSVNGTLAELAPDVWLSSYWQAPDQLAIGGLPDRSTADPNSLSAQDQGNRFVSILDTDKGEKLRCNLTRVGREAVAIGGEQKSCTHFRISGDKSIELWYDGQGRLVRQDSTEQRHKVQFELSEIAAD